VQENTQLTAVVSGRVIETKHKFLV
jgi:hypothetical protein